jgi:hypothetical protein
MSASNRRIGDLVSEIDEGKLNLRPSFQRRLVWTNSDKEKFIETVLKEYPFPEIFVATGELDLETTKRKNWLVDGQQRISTLQNYIRGSSDILYKTIPTFASLTNEEKTKFLDYLVAVRDLGTIGETQIKEIFQRINSTDYALKTMEKLNAMFSGVYNQYCEQLSRNPFFDRHCVFSSVNRKRMYDVTFCVILVTTILAGYYRRDEKNREYLERYNDDFPDQGQIELGILRVFSFIEQCGFPPDSRVWKQTDLFTVLVELYSLLIMKKYSLSTSSVGTALGTFFAQVDDLYSQKTTENPAGQANVFRYLKASTKASNDKYARVERAEVVEAIILGTIEENTSLENG